MHTVGSAVTVLSDFKEKVGGTYEESVASVWAWSTKKAKANEII